MTREEMIEKLHQIGVGVELTTLTSEMVLECEYVTSKGYKYEWIGIDDWPAYKLLKLSKETLLNIKEKFSNNKLDVSDLAGTILFDLYESFFASEGSGEPMPSLSEFFSDLSGVTPTEELFVICDISREKPTAHFYTDYKDFEKEFANKYINDVVCWEELSDAQLEEFQNRIENGFDRIPLVEFTAETDG
jgi:hypothetical protein